jgi:hypothetical protein
LLLSKFLLYLGKLSVEDGLIAQSPDRWKLAGDQLIVDMDLSDENISPGTKLKIGDAVIERTAQPHLGC